MSNPTERQPYRAYTCPQCGAPLDRPECSYCGTKFIPTMPAGIDAAWARGAEAAVRRRRDLGEPVERYPGDEGIRAGLYLTMRPRRPETPVVVSVFE